MTGWLSVDPMADKYPSISPYAYCAWNPVILTDPDGLKPRFMGLLNYLGIAKYGLSRAGEAKTIGNYYILPIYDAENKELIAYNAVRHRSNGDIVTEYQMDPGDLEMFRNNVHYYEMAANLLYCNGEPDWKYVAMTDNIFSGNIGGALSELGKMWKSALSNPSFYLITALSIISSDNPRVSAKVNQIVRDIKSIESMGGKLTFRPLNKMNLQELNMTIENNTQKINLRIETHPLDHKNPKRHMNVDYFENKGDGWKKNQRKSKHIIIE